MYAYLYACNLVLEIRGVQQTYRRSASLVRRFEHQAKLMIGLSGARTVARELMQCYRECDIATELVTEGLSGARTVAPEPMRSHRDCDSAAARDAVTQRKKDRSTLAF